MQFNRVYPTLSIATETLRKAGYGAEFVIEEEGAMKCVATEKAYAPSDMKIIEQHRFEGDSDPGDNSIVYAICCNDGEKGLIVSAYGMYGSSKLNDFMKEVEVAERTEVAGPVGNEQND